MVSQSWLMNRKAFGSCTVMCQRQETGIEPDNAEIGREHLCRLWLTGVRALTDLDALMRGGSFFQGKICTGAL